MDQDPSPEPEETKELTESEKAKDLPDPEHMVIDDAADDLVKMAAERVKGQPDAEESAVDALLVAAGRASGRAGADFAECFRLFSEVYRDGAMDREAAESVEDGAEILDEAGGGGMVN